MRNIPHVNFCNFIISSGNADVHYRNNEKKSPIIYGHASCSCCIIVNTAHFVRMYYLGEHYLQMSATIAAIISCHGCTDKGMALTEGLHAINVIK